MRNQSRKIEIFLKDGFFVGLITASYVDMVLSSIKERSVPSSLILEIDGKKVDGIYFEITSSFALRLDDERTQFFHAGQILLYKKGINLY